MNNLSLVVFSAEDLSNNVCAEDTFKTNLSKTSIEIFVRIEASFGQVEVCDDKCDSPDTGVLTGAGRVLCCPAPDTMDRGGNAEFNASLPVQILPGAGETKPTECPQVCAEWTRNENIIKATSIMQLRDETT
ncbi:hypothetical protein RUM44_010566 [Polyplax serrata]|uniref:Uncharacterized protein n=1 Tax=Polyplax serrata TaxID=468196 RepID=A0ABR1AVV5_POLSC